MPMNSYSLNQMSTKNKNILTSVLIVVISVLLSFGIYKGGREIHASMLLNQTQTAIQEYRYEDALNYTRQANVLNPDKSTLKLAYTKNLVASDNAFQNGESAEKSNKLDDAILSFKQVIEDDKKNHAKAQDKILALTEKLSQLMIQSAKDAYDSQQYENAYATLQKLLIKNPTFKAARDVENTYQLAAAKQRLAREKTELDSLLNVVSKLNITDALKKLNHYMEEDRDAGLKKQAQAQIEFLHKQQTQVMNTIDSMKQNDRYSGAIELTRKSLYIDSSKREALLDELRFAQTAYIKAEEERNRERDRISVNFGERKISQFLIQLKHRYQHRARGRVLHSDVEFMGYKILDRDNYGRRFIMYTVDLTSDQTDRRFRHFFYCVIYPEDKLFHSFMPPVNLSFHLENTKFDDETIQAIKNKSEWNIDPSSIYKYAVPWKK